MLKTMYDAFIGYSYVPTRFFTLVGLGVSSLTILIAIYLLGRQIFGDPLRGWTSIMLSIAFFFGVQFLLAGFIGEYLQRIYSEVVQRPLYFVSNDTLSSPDDQIGKASVTERDE